MAPVRPSWNPPSLAGTHATWGATQALTAFYAMGGLLCVVSLVVPSWPDRDDAVILAVGLAAALAAAVLPWCRGRLTWSAVHALVLGGSVLIALLVHAGGGGAASATYAGFYVWVAVYSFTYFRPRTAAAQVAVALLTEVAALLEVGQGAVVVVQVTLSAGTIVVTGAVVGVLAARLRRLTVTDELTGLLNRRALDRTLLDRLTLGRDRPATAVLGIDLDGFKNLNDTAGHAAGDALLQSVAGLWTAVLRPGDVLARTGGDEFVVVLVDCDDGHARAVAERLVAVTPAPVSACVGVVVVPGGKDVAAVDVDHVLLAVDAALYAGKRQGPGSVVVSDAPTAGSALG